LIRAHFPASHAKINSMPKNDQPNSPGGSRLRVRFEDSRMGRASYRQVDGCSEIVQKDA
jgi:hypothetical protein